MRLASPPSNSLSRGGGGGSSLQFCGKAFLYNKVLFTESAFAKFPQAFKFWLAYPEYWRLLNQKEYHTIDHPVLYLAHPYDSNFSHFTLQCLPGLLIAKAAGILGGGLKLAIANDTRFQKELIQLLGVTGLGIIRFEKNRLYKLTHCIYPTSLYDFMHGRDFVKYFESAVPNIKLDISPDIYITRRNARKRSTANEEDVIKFLRERNFEIVDFDNLPVAAQIALVRSARHICAAHGASGAHLAWVDPDRFFKFTEIFSSNRTAYCHTSLLESKNCDYSALINRAVAPSGIAGPDCPFAVNLELLDYALKNPIHKFGGNSTQDEAKVELAKLAEACASFVSDANKLKIEAENLRSQGRIAEAIATLKRVDIGLHRHSGINLLLKLTFMDCDLQEYVTLVNYIMTRRFQDCYCALSEFSILASDYGRAREIQSLLRKHGKNGIAEYYSRVQEAVEKIPLNSLMTWHFTTMAYDSANKKVVNIKESRANIEAVLDNGKVSLRIAEEDAYIAEIGQGGEVVLQKEPSWFAVIEKNQHNFVIVKDGTYLSARPDCSFIWMPQPLEWERFFIRKASLGGRMAASGISATFLDAPVCCFISQDI